jgi:hypothetical protein
LGKEGAFLQKFIFWRASSFSAQFVKFEKKITKEFENGEAYVQLW